MTDMTTRQALLVAKRRQQGLDKVERLATAASESRDRAFLAAQQAGASYADLQAATGLSSARVTQVLARARTLPPTTTED